MTNLQLNVPSADLAATIICIFEEMNRAKAKHPQWPTDNVKRAAIVLEEAGEVIREAKMSGEDNSRSIPVINTDTGISYHSVKLAAEANGITSRHLCKILRGEVVNKTGLKYLRA
jgi:hypothetical protein